VVQKEGEDRIVVELPGFEDVEQAKGLVKKTARLEFKLVHESGKLVEVFQRIDSYLVRKNRQEGKDGAESGTLETDSAFSPGFSDTGVVDIFGSAEPETPKAKEIENGKAVGDIVPGDSEAAPEVALGDSGDSGAEDLFSGSSGGSDSGDSGSGSGGGVSSSDRPFSSIFIGGSALQEFGNQSSQLLVPIDREKEVRELLAREDIQRMIPTRGQFLWGSKLETTVSGLRARPIYYLKSSEELGGDAIKDARSQPGQGTNAGTWVVELTMNSKGTKRFARVTDNNVKRFLAIVLDSVVYSAPVINEKIPNGRAVISGGSIDVEEAKLLSIILRGGEHCPRA